MAGSLAVRYVTDIRPAQCAFCSGFCRGGDAQLANRIELLETQWSRNCLLLFNAEKLARTGASLHGKSISVRCRMPFLIKSILLLSAAASRDWLPLHGCAVWTRQRASLYSKLKPSVLVRAGAPAELSSPKPLPAIFPASETFSPDSPPHSASSPLIAICNFPGHGRSAAVSLSLILQLTGRIPAISASPTSFPAARSIPANLFLAWPTLRSAPAHQSSNTLP